MKKGILVIILSVILLTGTALLIPKLGSEFMPKSESAEFTVELKLPEGTSLERTYSTASKTEGIIREAARRRAEPYLQPVGRRQHIHTESVVCNKGRKHCLTEGCDEQ